MLKTGKKKGFHQISEINVTPLVDVSLVLVIIFMVTVPMLFQPLAEVIMPKAYSGSEQSRQVIFINCTNDNQLFLDSEVVNFQSMSEQLTVRLLKSRDKTVILRADERLPYESITHIMAIAKKAGAKKLIFATDYKKR